MDIPAPKLIGELVVVALKATDLPNREIVGKQDPFCVFKVGDVAKRTKTVHRGGQHPVWDDQVNILIHERDTKMRVQLFDENGKREDLISEGEVDLVKVFKQGEQDDWFPLTYKHHQAGSIYLELTFYAAQPPPKRQPTRFRAPHSTAATGGRPQSANFSALYNHTPRPTNAGHNSSDQRPLPPLPMTSASTPMRVGCSPGPAYYGQPQPMQHRPADPGAYQHMAHTVSPAPAPVPAPVPSLSGGYNPGKYPPTTNPQAGNHPLLSAPYQPNSAGSTSNVNVPMMGNGYPPQHYNSNDTPLRFPQPQHVPDGVGPSPFAIHTGGYQPGPVGFAPSGGYPPSSANYPQAHSGYPPVNGGNAHPAPNGYPPNTGGYPPNTGGYPPNTGGYPPNAGGYPPNSGAYPPNAGSYPTAPGGYPPNQGGYHQASGGYPPTSQGYMQYAPH